MCKGALAENYAAQTLRASGYELYYWTSDSPTAKVDFLIQKKGKILPIEVKSGKNVSAKSLKHFQIMYEPEKVIRLSEKILGQAEMYLLFRCMQFFVYKF